MTIFKVLIFSGILLMFAGCLFYLIAWFFCPLGGDIVLKKDKFTFSFPLVTSLLVSLFLTILINVIFYLFRK